MWVEWVCAGAQSISVFFYLDFSLHIFCSFLFLADCWFLFNFMVAYQYYYYAIMNYQVSLMFSYSPGSIRPGSAVTMFVRFISNWINLCAPVMLLRWDFNSLAFPVFMFMRVIYVPGASHRVHTTKACVPGSSGKINSQIWQRSFFIDNLQIQLKSISIHANRSTEIIANVQQSS